MQPIRALLLVLLAVTCSTTFVRAADEPIQHSGFVQLGGIPQWVTIRGNDAGNPVLLVLHGGPGDAQSPFVQTYAPYEAHFVLVQWDQRGSGRTHARNGAADISLDRLTSDGIELTQHLRETLGRERIHVLGHSWGSLLGLNMVRTAPELFASFTGTGQVANWCDTVHFQFDLVLTRARAAAHQPALEQLTKVGRPDCAQPMQYFGWSRLTRQYLPAADDQWLRELPELASHAINDEALITSFSDGMMASARALMPSIVKTDLPKALPEINIPFFLIQGRHDTFTPTDLALAYYDHVRAPLKQKVVIEDAGHFAITTHPAEVIAALRAMIAAAETASREQEGSRDSSLLRGPLRPLP